MNSLPTRDRPTIVNGFAGTLWHILIGEHPAAAVWGNGTVAADTLCRNCRIEFNSWPPEGGRLLVSTAPEDISDVLTPGDLWMVASSRKAVHGGRGRFERAAWADSVTAIVLARPGVLHEADLNAGVVHPVILSLVPDWLRSSQAEPISVWTLRLENASFAHPDSARLEALSLRELGVNGYSLEPLADGSGYRLSVGAFPDSAAAVAAAGPLKKGAGIQGPVSAWRRPVSEMRGQFEFGSTLSPDGRRRIYFRSHPHLFLPHMASEVWIQSGSDARPRLAVHPVANF